VTRNAQKQTMGRNPANRKKRGPVPIKEIVVEIDDGAGSDDSGEDLALGYAKGVSRFIKPAPPKTKPPSFKFRSNQPSRDAIMSSVDYWFSKADMKTNTLADIYKSVEDHFQIEALSKANRKLVRSRLKELAAEKSILAAAKSIKEKEEGSKESSSRWKGKGIDSSFDSRKAGKLALQTQKPSHHAHNNGTGTRLEDDNDDSSVASEEIVFYPTSSSSLFYDYDNPPNTSTLLTGSATGATGALVNDNEKKDIEVEYQLKLLSNAAAAAEKNGDSDHQKRVLKGGFAHRGSGMELSSSVLRFKDINFIQGKEHERRILRGVSGTVKSGRK
jgi:hypothetical protein